MLKQRIITASILIPITLLVLIYFPPLAFAFATLALVLVAAWEWAGLMQVSRLSSRLAYLALNFIVCCLALFIPVIYLLSLALIWWVLAFLFIISYPQGTNYYKNKFVLSLMGLVTLVPCWGAINFIRNQLDGLYILFYLFGLIWGADIAAYFVGKKFGKTKLLPKVSPGKTWQGFIAALVYGTVYAIGVISLISLSAEVPSGVLPWSIILSVITVGFSVCGDLMESVLKRLAGVKDSGSILPGHGGMLDRIDSLTAAAPVFALGALLIGAYL